MSIAAPPLRFLAVVVGGWACFRAAMLVPEMWAGKGHAAPSAHVAEAGPRIAVPMRRHALDASPGAAGIASHNRIRARGERRFSLAVASPTVPDFATFAAFPTLDGRTAVTGSPFQLSSPAASALPVLAPPAGGNRWSASAWLYARDDGGTGSLAPGGTLGGSQAGARILYRLNADQRRPLALSVRIHAPLERTAGAEAALGIDWQPLAAVPVHILAERREKLGREGRSAFALTFYGGVSARPLARGLRLDAYGQAGMVGLKSRDLFADGALQVSVPVGPVEIGGGAWGAAQPGAARLDIGPQLSLRLPAAGAGLRLSADWRFRVAGDSEPGSGPALTLAADF